jgi:threonine dehydratase
MADQSPSELLSLADVRAAHDRIRDAIIETPTLHSQTLSNLTGANIFLKFENLQFTAAYKERGALNALLQLPEEARKRGVIAASAGNHAQGLSYHGTRLGVPVTIVMPKMDMKLYRTGSGPYTQIADTLISKCVTVTMATTAAV